MATRERIDNNLRDFLVWMKYAQYRPDLERRETFKEIIDRVEKMYIEKVPRIEDKIRKAFQYVREGYVLPSMRAMHFAGKGIEQNNARIYNCAALNIKTSKDIADTMFLLLSGCGVGVGLEHTKFTRAVHDHMGQITQFVVPDSIEGWAESFQVLLDAWKTGEVVEFIYDDIRPKGSPINSINALAPGPEGLKTAHKKCKKLLDGKIVLRPVDMIRFICFMAGAVMSGGIRRSALIGIVGQDDIDSQRLKQSPEWWKDYPELGYMNISVGWRSPIRPSRDYYTSMLETALDYGEPGIFNFGQEEYLTNPCGEIVLEPYQFCNLVEVNAAKLTAENQQEVFTAATILGFVQSRFTDFHFLQKQWKDVTEKDRLVGVSITGLAGIGSEVDLKRASNQVKLTLDILNDVYGEGAKVPRWTTVKPAGHTSLLFNVSSGIHAYPAPYYLRRISLGKDTVLGGYLKRAMPEQFLEDDLRDPSMYKLVVPMEAPEGAACQTDEDEALGMIDRITQVNREWINHGEPRVTNNISATVSIPKGEEEKILQYLWQGTGDAHKGVTVLRQLEHTFEQPIWEPICHEKYIEYVSKWPMFLSTDMLLEFRNNTDLQGEAACSAGGCEIS